MIGVDYQIPCDLFTILLCYIVTRSSLFGQKELSADWLDPDHLKSLLSFDTLSNTYLWSQHYFFKALEVPIEP